MKLKLVKINGYRRFGTPQALDARGRVVAVVGTNEAGKTSLLQAMRYLSTDGSLEAVDATDRVPRSDGDWVVSAHFALDQEDRQALGDVVPTRADVTFKVSKYPDGEYTWDVAPAMPRDLTWRRRAVDGLRRIVERDWLDEVDGADGGTPSFRQRAAALADALDTEGDWLPEEVREDLRQLPADVESKLVEDSRKALSKLVDLLVRTAQAEESTPPEEKVIEVLAKRVPKFLLFEGADLELATDHVWSEHKRPPAALKNLLALAGVGYRELRRAGVNDDRATLDTLTEQADARLDEAFKAWRQGDLHVTLSPNKESLQLHVRDRATTRRSRLDSRSDGLRRFAALVAFTALHGGDSEVRPILLIDEAETHLHYGAQADLVRVFERQQAAETIIYTTHSIGCLPTDLGSAIRVVSPDRENPDRSVIRNSVWADEGRRIGMTPMMLAMGANALAFTPSRRAVIGEGATEAILLPSLIRAALPADQQDQPLGYQVVPGVSEVDPEDAADLEMDAGAVAYLIDNDEGGRGHRRKLPQRAKDEGRVIVLGDGRTEGLCTEDYVNAKVLVRAVNNVLDRHAKSNDARLAVSDLPAVGRGAHIDAWCMEAHGFRLNKVLIAHETLALGTDGEGLVTPSRRRGLLALHKKLRKATSAPLADSDPEAS